ncbi:putative sugar and nucleotide-binding domains containing protein [Synechococcus sp. Minos11]|uniref:four-carbon acid sugar kinase family protein n=1 Tax=Synechococcus sp. Minos11 TaxID=221341 RepID=UPI0016487F93|nr:four-carbon acid sugar kinase family protein [Synechococcus sp. Minos11]QNJ07641.1 putative sugar and nucleotide-binding domains containing protein [Synechococcus sp. Minos11]
MASSPKIIVFDDDPTGSQTVRGCPLLLDFSTATLQAGLADPSPLLFLLTNSRALEPEQVRQELTALCRRLKPLLAQLTRPWMVVSRGDSTLRGHTPLELEVIRAELGPFAANLLVPAFPQGGRTTKDGVHLLQGEPLHHSAFARDQRFGYPSSDLPQWLEHKTAGLIQANVVVRLKPAESLAELKTGQWAVLDASSPNDLELIGERVLAELGLGRKHLCQSAASLLNGLSGMPSVLLEPREVPPIAAPGLVLVGSHVPLSDAQLVDLLEQPGCSGVEFSLDEPQEPSALRDQLQQLLSRAITPVLFSSRGERPGYSPAKQRDLALQMAQVVMTLELPLGYVIAKGGTTSLTLLRQGLQLQQVRLLGQLLPGLSMVQPPVPHPRFGRLPVVTFPGNLGDRTTLSRCWQLLEAARH